MARIWRNTQNTPDQDGLDHVLIVFVPSLRPGRVAGREDKPQQSPPKSKDLRPNPKGPSTQ